jgi:hypothetical protein
MILLTILYALALGVAIASLIHNAFMLVYASVNDR